MSALGDEGQLDDPTGEGTAPDIDDHVGADAERRRHERECDAVLEHG